MTLNIINKCRNKPTSLGELKGNFGANDRFETIK